MTYVLRQAKLCLSTAAAMALWPYPALYATPIAWVAWQAGSRVEAINAKWAAVPAATDPWEVREC